MKIRILLISLVALFIGIFINYTNKDAMSDNYIGPFLSAAANYTIGNKYFTSLDQINEFKNLTYQEQLKFRFARDQHSDNFNHSPIGYILLIFISKLIFGFFFGDMQSIIFFQLMFHILISIYFLKLLSKDRLKFWLFTLFYVLNPFIIYFATFNFYYFWQVIPSVFLLLLIFDPKLFGNLFFVILSSILLGIVLISRPTLVLIVALFLAMLFMQKEIKRSLKILGIIFFIITIFFFYSPSQKSLWHSVYVGIGSYKNPYGIILTDDAAYKYYEEIMKVKVNASFGGNYYDENFSKSYNGILKGFCINAFLKKPFLFIKNGFLNFGQSFFIGYYNGAKEILNIILSLIGYSIILLVLILRIRKAYLYILGITFHAITYCLFFPPIQAYNYGAFILVVFILIDVFDTFYQRILKSRVHLLIKPINSLLKLRNRI